MTLSIIKDQKEGNISNIKRKNLDQKNKPLEGEERMRDKKGPFAPFSN